MNSPITGTKRRHDDLYLKGQPPVKVQKINEDYYIFENREIGFKRDRDATTNQPLSKRQKLSN